MQFLDTDSFNYIRVKYLHRENYWSLCNKRNNPNKHSTFKAKVSLNGKITYISKGE